MTLRWPNFQLHNNETAAMQIFHASPVGIKNFASDAGPVSENALQLDNSIFVLTVRYCEALTAPNDGSILGTCSRTYLSECSFQCDEGYELLGNETRQCTVMDKEIMDWSGTTVTCEGKCFAACRKSLYVSLSSSLSLGWPSFFPACYTFFYGLYREVTIDCRVLFLSSLSETGYIISCDSVQIINRVLLA